KYIECLNENPYYDGLNISEMLYYSAQKFPLNGISHLEGLSASSCSMSYASLLERSELFARNLILSGIVEKTKIALLIDETFDFFTAFWGCIIAGCIPCTLTKINDVERWETHLIHINSLLDNPLLITTDTHIDSVSHLNAYKFDKYLESSEQVRLPTLRDPSETAVIVLTSGSTGNSKGVVLSHRHLFSSVVGRQGCRNFCSEDIILNWISFDHVASLTESHMIALFSGANWMHIDTVSIVSDPILILKIFSKYKVTSSLVPNFLLGQINALLQEDSSTIDTLSGIDLSSLKHIITGGEANVVQTAVTFLSLLEPYNLNKNVLWPGFGMTETCGGAFYSKDFPSIDKSLEFSTFNCPIEGFDWRVTNECGEEVKNGDYGELQLSGPMVFNGYLNNEEENNQSFTSDGWFRTGDSARVIDGRLELSGRNKDSIIVNGINYYNQVLEASLEKLDGIEKSYLAAFSYRPEGADTENLVVAFSTSFFDEDDI
ncbi:AMP-binding protein, partial [Vibrio mediterranei]|uniref:AMP-binding protein n=1 Tax=Vibrio mediterranei TaxID=689 RepID=UPI001EFD4C36